MQHLSRQYYPQWTRCKKSQIILYRLIIYKQKSNVATIHKLKCKENTKIYQIISNKVWSSNVFVSHTWQIGQNNHQTLLHFENRHDVVMRFYVHASISTTVSVVVHIFSRDLMTACAFRSCLKNSDITSILKVG